MIFWILFSVVWAIGYWLFSFLWFTEMWKITKDHIEDNSLRFACVTTMAIAWPVSAVVVAATIIFCSAVED